MAIEKLSDGNPSVLAIGPYGGELKTFDDSITTKLLNELRELIGVYCIHPFETDYEDMPEVDFTMSLGPPARARMLDEDPDYHQKYDKGASFQDVMKSRTRIACIILQEIPWGPQSKGALNFSFGPTWGTLQQPSWNPEWGKGWFKEGETYYLYPFEDKQEFHPGEKEDFVFVDCSDQWHGNHDFSDNLIQALDELGVGYFRASTHPDERVAREEYVKAMNRAKLYFHIKAESYGLTLLEAVAAETIAIGTIHTIRRLYATEFNFHHIPTMVEPTVEVLKNTITKGLEAYDKPEIQERLHAMREKLWTYERLAKEISDILKSLKR